ncbi:MAG: NAD(P)-dependent oxidoreductase [Pseudanabaena sp.]|jgi:3-hydroxyisobutyrate dehydrogenase|uniref:NAD(P)-dependent oxidoreductase n=1 Tax=Pseudanabaena mucicola TaxID=71190 RepID=UPI0025752E1C|nr:NAD(P)-dependent oxidoreductase [Pseudanabaena mucicola]MCA6574264.1 NAD(P)-dependent oxidoreductase [Pseudanabaena sp. M53BS1SP1A06MG]MCA6584458.1 NAD(P)-dependent oxidoreductase [Pseudanabaena sp. M34BS1SP1A06MG]MCA6586316.1 NAD(P)-dependent oxidoreductase [Pseudanabaena sp. M051S1SP1A06QC]MCA6590388.1 NAD(P)-dependent oxidoreductase [Pseudanabaena sp. M109S1SP1A06QC]MCA6594569.1 NAD(P)-dependent oxidoreductase [Pseudanabaena sp. M38BS1SP1A06MG]MCA6596022.1 NAD(P)-dependent oxidoreductas
MTQKIAFLGLGLMGGAMAANLVKRGYSVIGWNRTQSRPTIIPFTNAGGTLAQTLQEAVSDADVIFSCLGDVPDVTEVLIGEYGAMNFAKANTLFIDTSTIGSDAAKVIANALMHDSLRFLDAPVSGGDVGARNGTLTFMVGGNPEDLQECRPLFEAMGSNIKYCGAIGSGQAVKLCNQTLVSVYMLAICETMLMAKKMGIDPQLIVDVCGSGAAGSWALTNLGMKVATGDYQPGFAIKHMLKDLRLVQEISQGLGQDSDLKDFATNLPAIALAIKNFQKVSQLDDGQGTEQGTQAMIRAY